MGDSDVVLSLDQESVASFSSYSQGSHFAPQYSQSISSFPGLNPEDLEPTPILEGASLVSRQGSTPRLPQDMLLRCDMYISLLRGLSGDGQNSSTKDSMPHLLSAEGQTSKQALSMKIYPYQNEKWMVRYQELAEYHQIHGNCNVPYHYKANPQLSQWVKRQRHQYKCLLTGKHSHLTLKRVKLLERIGFIWDSHAAAWEENFAMLKVFHKYHNHVQVPISNYQLSTWLKRQRRHYKRYIAGQKSTMTAERVRRLSKLGFELGRRTLIGEGSC